VRNRLCLGCAYLSVFIELEEAVRMLTAKELHFTECFLAGLKRRQITEFPIGNSAFESGVEKMAHGLITSSNLDQAFEYDLDTLFSRVPLSGNYARFIEALGHLNGRSLSLENPRLIKATIKMSNREADSLIEQSDPPLRKLVENAVSLFAEGAVLHAATA
jgi:hypothetical protein